MAHRTRRDSRGTDESRCAVNPHARLCTDLNRHSYCRRTTFVSSWRCSSSSRVMASGRGSSTRRGTVDIAVHHTMQSALDRGRDFAFGVVLAGEAGVHARVPVEQLLLHSSEHFRLYLVTRGWMTSGHSMMPGTLIVGLPDSATTTSIDGLSPFKALDEDKAAIAELNEASGAIGPSTMGPAWLTSCSLPRGSRLRCLWKTRTSPNNRP